jgi:hypothetical protein
MGSIVIFHRISHICRKGVESDRYIDIFRICCFVHIFIEQSNKGEINLFQYYTLDDISLLGIC